MSYPSGKARFGEFRLDLRTGELQRNGCKSTLQEKPFQILVTLLEGRGELIKREELKKRLWPSDTFVDFDQSLNRAMSRLREALDDSAEAPRFIETLPKRGYRFIAPVEFPLPELTAQCQSTPVLQEHATSALEGRTDESRSDEARRKHRGWLFAGVALAVMAVAVFVLLLLRSRRITVIDSIAVMPFKNASGEADLDYLDDGLTQSLINNLSQLPHVRVMPWSAVYGYKGKTIDARKVGADLGVGAIFTGRTLRQGDRLSINTELLDTRGNKLISAEQYLRTPDDLFAFQGELSRDILARLRQNLTPEEVKQISERPTANPEAYRLFLEGLFYSNLLTRDNLERAIVYLQQAIAKDENFALAYATLARTYQFLTIVGQRPSDTLPQAKAAALRAIELDPNSGMAHQSLGWIFWQLDWDYPSAERELRRAVELRPNGGQAHFQLALVLMQLRRFDEAENELKQAQELYRWDPSINTFLAMPYYFAGNYEAAAEQLRKALDINSSYWVAHMFMGRVLTQQGKYAQAIEEYKKAGRASLEPISHIGYVQAITGHRAEARQTMEELVATRERQFVQPSDVARIYAGLGDGDSAIAWLSRGAQEKEFGLSIFNIDPEFASLHSDPRFQALMRHVGLTR